MMPWIRLGVHAGSAERWERLLTGLLATKEVNGNCKDDPAWLLCFDLNCLQWGLTIVLGVRWQQAVIALAIRGVLGLARKP